MIDLTQQRMAEYEAYLNELLQKLKVPDPIYSKEQIFNWLTVAKMSEMIDVERKDVNCFRLESGMKQLTDKYIRKLV